MSSIPNDAMPKATAATAATNEAAGKCRVKHVAKTAGGAAEKAGGAAAKGAGAAGKAAGKAASSVACAAKRNPKKAIAVGAAVAAVAAGVAIARSRKKKTGGTKAAPKKKS